MEKYCGAVPVVTVKRMIVETLSRIYTLIGNQCNSCKMGWTCMAGFLGVACNSCSHGLKICMKKKKKEEDAVWKKI